MNFFLQTFQLPVAPHHKPPALSQHNSSHLLLGQDELISEQVVSPPLKTDRIFVVGSEWTNTSFAGGSHLAALTNYDICINELQMCCTLMLVGSSSIQVKGGWSLLTLHSSTAVRICWGHQDWAEENLTRELQGSSPFSGSGSGFFLLRDKTDVKYSLTPPWRTVAALQHECAELSNKYRISPQAQVTNIFTYLGQNWACGKCKYHSLMDTEQNILIESHHALTVTGSMAAKDTKGGPTYSNALTTQLGSATLLLIEGWKGRRGAFKHIKLLWQGIFCMPSPDGRVESIFMHMWEFIWLSSASSFCHKADSTTLCCVGIPP